MAAKAALASIVSVLILLGIGCCGVVPNLPAAWQADAWVTEGMPPGTTAAAATDFLLSKGFTVYGVDLGTAPHRLRASKTIGKCYLNFTYDKLYIISMLDASDHVVSTRIELGIAPGI